MSQNFYCKENKRSSSLEDLEKLLNESSVLNSEFSSLKIFNSKLAVVELLAIIDFLEPQLRNYWLNPTSPVAKEHCINTLSYYLERKQN